MTFDSTIAMSRRMQGLAVRAQRGAAQLFITIVLLIVIMMLGITAAVLSGTQFKLAGNLQFENLAFNQGEAAAAVALSWLATGTNAQNAGFTAYASGSTPHLYPISSTVDPLAISWSDSNSVAVGGDDSKRYFIQKIAKGNQLVGTTLNLGDTANAICPKVDLFRITTRGTSAKGTTKIIQTVVHAPSQDPCD